MTSGLERIEGQFHYAVRDVVAPTAPMWAVKRKDDDYPITRLTELAGDLFVRDHIKELDDQARHFHTAGQESCGDELAWLTNELAACRVEVAQAHAAGREAALFEATDQEGEQ